MALRKTKLIMGLLLVNLMVVGCTTSNNAETPPVTNEQVVEEEVRTEESVQQFAQNPIVTMVIKDYGTLTLELYPEKAPNTVNNFVTLANEGFYDGLTFHRIVEGFMIQGGDPDGVGTGGPGHSIVGEFINNGYEHNDLLHTKGVISMARSMDPDSAGSQFFIMSADHASLDANYAAFGEVTSGIEIIEQIEKVEVKGETPTEAVVIESITVDTNGEEIPEVIKVAF